jgi:hypothetical protein
MTAVVLAPPSAVAVWLAEESGPHIPGVERVLFLEKADWVFVWTVVPDFDRATCDLVYAAEGRLIDAHPEVSFHFHVVTSVDSVPAEACTA